MQKHSFALQESFFMPVLDNGHSKVVHLSFPKGKVLDRHVAPSDILIFVISGKIEFQYGEHTVLLQQGDMVSLEKKIEHALTALEESVVALVITPSPAALAPKPTGTPLPMQHKNAAPPNGAVSPQLQSFVEEHAELVEVMNQARTQETTAAYQKAIQMIGDELNQHFRYEEDILFPLLGKYIGTSAGPIAVMLGEHKIIREQHNRVLQAFQANHEVSADVRQSFSVLAETLGAHIIKEDNVLFPMASSVMSQEDQDEVARRVEAEKQK